MTDLQPPPPEETPPPRRHWMRVVLVLSLAANLAVAGLVLGAWITHDGPGSRHERPRGERDPAMRALGFGPYARAIPREARDGLKEAVEARRGELRANRDTLRSAFEATLATLRAEPFDRAAMAEQMATQRAAISDSQQIGHEILLDRLERMSPEERAAFADRLERGLGREPGRKKARD